MDDPTVAVWSLSISWCQSHTGQLVQLVQLLDLFGFAKLAFGGIGTLETARTASVHSLPCTQEKGIYEPTRTRLFSFLEHEVERRRKDSGQRVHL